MTSARKPSGFLQVNYDKIAIVAVIAALLISTIILLLRVNSEARPLNPSDLDANRPIAVEPFEATALDALSFAIENPYQVPASQRRMLAGELRVSSIPDGLPIPYQAAVCPFTGTAQPVAVKLEERDSDGDGIPDVWETRYGLNPLDPNDAQLDLDGDGFTNLEEFLAGTDPTNPESFPPPSAKLRLARTQVNPFMLRFLGTSRLTEKDVRYQLNLRTLERTYFVRMQEDVEGFVVTAYDEKAPEGPTLTLTQGEKVIRLVQGRVRDEQAYTALLVFLVDGKGFRANIGETFALLDKRYKVIDIREDRVVIRDEDSGDDIDIGMLSPEERRKLTPGG